ncbi:hypothetical protein Q9966_013412 [Columba livia]|nr:hypothetical protein Q9966_013412 [Columba livia]
MPTDALQPPRERDDWPDAAASRHVASRMRMIESMDSAVSRPSEELWAEICSCLPRPEQMDPGDAFTDSFVAPCAPGSGSGGSAPANPKPWAPLSDSEVYLASLERRLMRIKGLSQEVTSKDMLRTLAQARQECWDRFLQEKFESECYVEGHDSEESTLEQLKRWLQPDKVAVSTEEVQLLLPPEPPGRGPEEEPPAAEHTALTIPRPGTKKGPDDDDFLIFPIEVSCEDKDEEILLWNQRLLKENELMRGALLWIRQPGTPALQ